MGRSNYISPVTPQMILEARAQHGHSRPQACKVIGCSEKQLYRWEKGQSPPGLMSTRALLSYIVGGQRLAAKRQREEQLDG